VSGGKQYHCKKCFDNKHLPRECDTCRISADKTKFNIVLKNTDSQDKKYYCDLACYKKGNISNTPKIEKIENLPVITDILDKSDVNSLFNTNKISLKSHSEKCELEIFIENYDLYGDIGVLNEIQGFNVDTDCMQLKSDSPPTLVLLVSQYDQYKMRKLFFLNRLALFLREKKTAPLFRIIDTDSNKDFNGTNLPGKILFYFDEIAYEEFKGNYEDVDSLRKFVKDCMNQPYGGVIDHVFKKKFGDKNGLKNAMKYAITQE
jgi:hypothetical protein